MRRIHSRLVLAFFGVALLGLTAAVDDTVQRMIRGHDLIASIYQRIISEYVEEVSPDELLKAGVKGMLDRLDPYAELIEEKENSEVDMLARGSYSGLGIKVRKLDGRHVVSYIYDEVRPLTNLRLGDILLRIDSVDLRTTVVDELQPLLRGPAGTSVRLLIRRPGLHDSLQLTAVRRNISIDPLPYQTLLDDDIFYMKLSRFTRSSVDSVKHALHRIYRRGGVRGIIIDVRDNPGGLLESAVGLVSQFVKPGTPIVAMKGRQPAYARNYVAQAEPIDIDVPIAVLVNAQSASASEIVAGALQDLDRAVIIGQRTFGKGLVQTLIPLSHDAFLKLTTSRYFIPSGRCIQRLSYENGKARNLSDGDREAPVFRTLRLSRPVRESNGIVPDIIIRTDSLSPLLACLGRHDAVFSFVALYANQYHPLRPPDVNARIKGMFKRYVDSLAACEGGALNDALRTLKDEASRQRMPGRGMGYIRDLETEIRKLHASQFDRQWEEIRGRLRDEFRLQLLGVHESMRASIAVDESVAKAVSLLKNGNDWEAALRGHGTH
jgi:carboxyl-terminal processing protease